MSIRKASTMLSLFLVTIMAMTVLMLQEQQITHARASGRGFPSVKGAQIFDGNNQPLTLRGAMIESSFAYIQSWQNGNNPQTFLNTNTFTVMVQQWHMNTLRINISQWVYNLDPATYMTRLDTVIQQANAAGVYVVLDFHDNVKGGAVAPYNDFMLHRTSLRWWKMLASHYINNPMVVFDLINEPQYPDWATWLHGDGADIVGINDVITAIRSTGAQQIIVVEPGSAGSGNSVEGGWATFDLTTITDPNVIYSKHAYQGIINGNPTTWDQTWGPLLNKRPIYYGEWALLPNSPGHCTGLTSANADSITGAFLTYLAQRNANWTAWDFKPFHLTQDTTTFQPTSFATGSPWVCGDPAAAQAGMGLDVKTYLN